MNEIDEVGKLFECIIRNRLLGHMGKVGPNLADNQFGFRAGLSAVDAILRLKRLAKEAVSQGIVVLAVSLDIAKHQAVICIIEALKYYSTPFSHPNYSKLSHRPLCVVTGARGTPAEVDVLQRSTGSPRSAPVEHWVRLGTARQLSSERCAMLRR